MPARARAWAGLLACGEDAALEGRTASWLWGVLDDAPRVVEVGVPWRRKVVAPSGVVATRRRRLEPTVHPVVQPRRVRLEDALLDVTDGCTDAGAVVTLVLRAVQLRRTTPERLRATVAARRRARHRALLLALLQDVQDGVLSALELRYQRRVHRPHRLPPAVFNAAEGGSGRRRYRDVLYELCVVELDSAQAHPEWLRHLDRGRDNELVLRGVPSLRYGWFEVATSPCAVAGEVGGLLQRLGWTGSPTPCGPECELARRPRADRPA